MMAIQTKYIVNLTCQIKEYKVADHIIAILPTRIVLSNTFVVKMRHELVSRLIQI